MLKQAATGDAPAPPASSCPSAHAMSPTLLMPPSEISGCSLAQLCARQCGSASNESDPKAVDKANNVRRQSTVSCHNAVAVLRFGHEYYRPQACASAQCLADAVHEVLTAICTADLIPRRRMQKMQRIGAWEACQYLGLQRLGMRSRVACQQHVTTRVKLANRLV
eukprot:scaffold5171_cov126-Isochrysis_galbana.AAC.4